ncbi:hypothetical protein CCMSSC00406_0009210 [Pleurotus cornucopiae]|uniref:Uncharacterized protein n=1 Tax=Pleurotus cornucopiae TaxID=5321 RepID=A0ACB7IUY1_PLECO|nr:hypothetical protein CCMSSC00406_0009210 [Pleurotus cornucopiae]
MCLYDWAIRCKRVKINKKTNKNSGLENDSNEQEASEAKEINPDEYDDDNNDDIDDSADMDNEDTDRFLSGSKRSKQVLLEYTPEHPLSSTHRCALMLETNKKLSRTVLNFMSAPPRRDQGDREYYCSAMLAFFVPWRSSKDLKTANTTWDEAFLAQDFSTHHSKIMNNFNLQYECLDAKDDFRTEMKVGASSELSLPFSDDVYVAKKCEDGLDDILTDASDINLKIEADKMCAAALRRDKAIKSMKAMMQNTNWATPLHSTEGVCISNNDIVQQLRPPQKSPREWRQQVQTLRQQVLEARKQTGSSRGDSKPSCPQPCDYDYVKVVDKSYLEAAYIPKIHCELVTECVTSFSLNEEQNRAFTIVANHTVAENSGQLKMYIGGMGGTGKSQVLKALVHLFTSRNELHKLLVVAPTASAACLLPGGMTYHSAFGINFAVSKSVLSSTKERLEGVSYVFFDEISMCEHVTLSHMFG